MISLVFHLLRTTADNVGPEAPTCTISLEYPGKQDMCQKESKKEFEKSKDPTLLERLYRSHSLDGTIPTEEGFEERIKRAIEESEKEFQSYQD